MPSDYEKMVPQKEITFDATKVAAPKIKKVKKILDDNKKSSYSKILEPEEEV